jgi:DNA-binding CsgD family transcriptional regulator
MSPQGERQSSLSDYATDSIDLSPLTPREQEIVEAVILGDRSVRGWQREHGLSPGTVSKHLERARGKVPELRQLQAGEGSA